MKARSNLKTLKTSRAATLYVLLLPLQMVIKSQQRMLKCLSGPAFHVKTLLLCVAPPAVSWAYQLSLVCFAHNSASRTIGPHTNNFTKCISNP